MYTVNHILEFEYNHLLVQIIRQCDTNNEVKSSSSYNDKLQALKLSWLAGYSTGDD